MNLLQHTFSTSTESGTSGIARLKDGIVPGSLCVQGIFSLTSGSTGALIDAIVQTYIGSTDASPVDMCSLHFSTASAIKAFNLSSLTPLTTAQTLTSGTMGSSASQDGVIGSMFQVKYSVTGAPLFAGCTLRIDVNQPSNL